MAPVATVAIAVCEDGHDERSIPQLHPQDPVSMPLLSCPRSWCTSESARVVKWKSIGFDWGVK